MNATNPLAQTGGTIAADVNGTLIKVTNMGGHFHLYVQAGADRIPELTGNYPTAQSACRRASYLRNALLVGIGIQRLVEDHLNNQAGVLAAANATLDGALRDVNEIAAGVNANLDTVHAARQAALDNTARLVEEALTAEGAPDPHWREGTRRQIVAQANQGLGRYAQGTPNQRTRHLPVEDMKDCHLRALAAVNPAGEVHVGPGVATTALRVLASAGYGRLICGGTGRRTYEIVKLQLTDSGLSAARQIGASL